jgi:hypothetical protein
MNEEYSHRASLVILYKDERGFWGGDCYCDCAEMDMTTFNALGMCPDGYFTRKKGGTLFDALTYARQVWPGARVEMAEDES